MSLQVRRLEGQARCYHAAHDAEAGTCVPCPCVLRTDCVVVASPNHGLPFLVPAPVRQVHPRRLVGAVNNSSWLRGIMVGALSFVDRPLKLGDLRGNEFTIVLRNVAAPEEVVAEAVTAWETSGFVNYFGLQRFGTGVTPNHKIGIALLKNDWAAAVDLLVGPKPEGSGENPVVVQARSYYASSKVRGARTARSPPLCSTSPSPPASVLAYDVRHRMPAVQPTCCRSSWTPSGLCSTACTGTAPASRTPPWPSLRLACGCSLSTPTRCAVWQLRESIEASACLT